MELDIVSIVESSLLNQANSIIQYVNSQEFSYEEYSKALELLCNCSGTVICTGMGKSGNIAGKIASTLTSTGTPAVFLHPGEALHGGLGLIRKGDVVLAISKSGNTAELRDMIPAIKVKHVPVISITTNRDSIIGRSSDVVLSYSAAECCGVNLIPTTSSTMALVIGDGLSMALMKYKKFKVENFAHVHPGGTLGETLRSSIGKIEFEHVYSNGSDETDIEIV